MAKIEDILIQKGLTNKEALTASMAIEGMSNREIASQLGIEERVVKMRFTNIYRKSVWKSRAQLIVWSLNINININERI